ncbi:hypothetical protein NHQ30_010695 [Ciborinia camelliae]|nr:hypothetical protein NHQ30_010695 [Ciborinia camelliae]
MEDKVNTGGDSENETGIIDSMSLVGGNSNTRAPLAPFVDGEEKDKDKYTQLTEEEQRNMSTSIAEIFKLEEEVGKAGEADVDDDDADEVVDVEDRERRTERLKGALRMLAHLWWHDSLFINEAAEKLADGSRDRELPFKLHMPPHGVIGFTWSSGSCEMIRRLWRCIRRSKPILILKQLNGEFLLETPEF